MTLVGKTSRREISAKALLDSGAEGIIIDHEFTKSHNLTLCTLVHPIPVRNVDGTPNKQGTVKHTTIQQLRIKSLTNAFHEETAELYITSLGDHDIILGTDWLKAHNPEVDWAKPRLALTRCPTTCKLSTTPMIIESRPRQRHSPTLGAFTTSEDTEEPTHLLNETNVEDFIQFHQQYKNGLTIQVKITHSTEIAARTAPKPSIEHIPTEFRQYAKVFNEEASYRLPARRPWDHAINLIPERPPWKRTGIYSLTPLEEQVLKEWPDNSL